MDSLASPVFEKPNLTPPESILCTSFERLEIELMFNTDEINEKKPRMSRATSGWSSRPQTHNNCIPVYNINLREPQCTMASQPDLSQIALQNSGITTSCYSRPNSSIMHLSYRNMPVSEENLQILTYKSGSDYFPINSRAHNGKWSSILNENKVPQRRLEVNRVASDGGKSSDQYLDHCKTQHELRLEISLDEDEMLLDQNRAYLSVRLNQKSNIEHKIPPLWPDRSTLSSLKRSYSDHVNISLTDDTEFQNTACEMLSLVLNLIIAGPFGRYHQKFQACKLEKPHPKLSLAKLVPSLFSLNFARVSVLILGFDSN